MVALIIFPILNILIPLLITIRSDNAIDEYKFKLYKVKYFWFLFVGIGFKSARTHGLILPMLIMQIQGYLFGIASLLIIWLHEAYYIFEEYTVVCFVQISFAVHGIIVITILLVTLSANDKRTKFLRKKSKEEKKIDEFKEFHREWEMKVKEAKKAQKRLDKQNKKIK